jgi:misacylated tRNA(Ala) deacylase
VAVEGNAVELDRTAFYPGGGGQMADRGTLSWQRADERMTAPVTALERRAGRLWHVLELAGSPAPMPGTAVHGELDWDFRYTMMRSHTALHVLCGIIWREFGAQVSGCQMYPDRSRMDFTLEDLNPERVQLIEQRINAAVAAELPVRIRTLPREEAFQIPDLIRTRINLLPPHITEVRTVEIVGLDLQADGGTHLRNTREIGRVRIVKTENKGKHNKRLEIVVE